MFQLTAEGLTAAISLPIALRRHFSCQPVKMITGRIYFTSRKISQPMGKNNHTSLRAELPEVKSKCSSFAPFNSIASSGMRIREPCIATRHACTALRLGGVVLVLGLFLAHQGISRRHVEMTSRGLWSSLVVSHGPELCAADCGLVHYGFRSTMVKLPKCGSYRPSICYDLH